MPKIQEKRELPPYIFERLKLAAQNDEQYQKFENDRITYKSGIVMFLLVSLTIILLLITPNVRNHNSWLMLLIILLFANLAGFILCTGNFVKALRNSRERFTRIFLDVVPPEYYRDE